MYRNLKLSSGQVFISSIACNSFTISSFDLLSVTPATDLRKWI